MMKKDKKKKSSILRFYPFTKGFRGNLLLAMFTVIIANIASFLTPQVIRVTVDSVINDQPFSLPGFVLSWIDSFGGREALRSHIIVCAAAALLFAVINGVANFVSRMNLAKGCEGAVESLRNTLFGHIQRLPYAWHNSHQTGDIIQRCTQDVELIRRFVNEQLMTVIHTLLAIAISLSLMFTMNVQLSLVVLCFIPLVLGYSMIFFVLVGKKFDQADRTEGELTALVQENLTGVRVVRAFGRERFEIERFNKKNQEFADLWSHLGRILGVDWGLGELFAGLQALVIMVIGVFFVERGSITEGEFLAFTAYNSMLAWPVAQLGRVLSELSKTSISSTRLFDILDAAEETDCEHPRTPPMDGDIVFDHVSFGYGSEPGPEGCELHHKGGHDLRHLRRYRQRQVHPYVSSGQAL